MKRQGLETAAERSFSANPVWSPVVDRSSSLVGDRWAPRIVDSTPLVSVVMAVYRPHPVYFPEAVRSVLTQTVSNLELVIVEDPSPASGVDMLKGIDDPRVRHHVNSTRTCLVDQRNLCVAKARSDFVAILDADDVAEPD